MATIVQLPRDPNPFAGLAQLGGLMWGRSIAEARQKERSRKLLDTFGELFPNAQLDEQTKARLAESGAVEGLEDLATILEVRRSGEVQASVTRRDDTGEEFTTPMLLPRSVLQQGRLPEEMQERGLRLGERTAEPTSGATFYRDQPELEMSGFGTERERAKGKIKGITLQEHKAKYPDAHTGAGKETDKQKAYRRAIEARGLPATARTFEAARIQVDEFEDISRHISEGFGDKFGETFSFDTQHKRRLRDRATEIADDILWEMAANEDLPVPSVGDVAQQAVTRAIRELGAPSREPESELEGMERAGQPAPEETGGFGSFFSGESDKTQPAQSDPLRTANEKADKLEDQDVDQVSELIYFTRYKEAVEFLQTKGFTPEEAREFVLFVGENSPQYGQ